MESCIVSLVGFLFKIDRDPEAGDPERKKKHLVWKEKKNT